MVTHKNLVGFGLVRYCVKFQMQLNYISEGNPIDGGRTHFDDSGALPIEDLTAVCKQEGKKHSQHWPWHSPFPPWLQKLLALFPLRELVFQQQQVSLSMPEGRRGSRRRVPVHGR